MPRSEWQGRLLPFQSNTQQLAADLTRSGWILDVMHRDFLSSHDYAQSGFAPHGEFRCRLERDVLMWVSRGPFNLEALQAYGRVRKAAFERWGLNTRPVGAVMQWVGSALMSPDAFTLYRRGFDAFMASHHTLIAVAWVGGPDVEGLDFMRAHYAPLFEAHGLPFRVFDDLPPAVTWVALLVEKARPPIGPLGIQS